MSADNALRGKFRNRGGGGTYASDAYPEYPMPGDGVVDESAAISSLYGAIPVDPGGVMRLAPGTHLVGTNLTIERVNRKGLHIAPGARFYVNAGVTLTIDAPIHAAKLQVFDGPGTVVLGGTNRKVHPAWFGAAFDLVQDDTAPLRKSIASLARGTVALPAAAAKITGAITLTTGIGMVGAGKGVSQLVWYGGNTEYMLQLGTGSNGKASTSSNVQVSHFNLSGDVVGQVAPAGGIDIRDLKWTGTIEHLGIYGKGALAPNYTGIGINYQRSLFFNNIRHCNIERWDRGIYIPGYDSATSTDASNSNVISQNAILNNRYGIEYGGGPSTNQIVRDNLFEHNKVYGIYAASVIGFVIEGNRFEGCGVDGGDSAQVMLTNCQGARVQGNYLTTAGLAIQHAIRVFGGSNVWVENNTEGATAPHTAWFIAANTAGIVRARNNQHSAAIQGSTVFQENLAYIAKATGDAQSIPTTAWTRVGLTTTQFDNDGMVDLTADTITPSRRAGLARISANAGFSANNTGQRAFRILRDRGGTITTLTIASSNPSGVTAGAHMPLYTVQQLQTGDKIYLEVYQDSGAALALSTISGDSPGLTVELVK